jgi:hypothetical protein
MRLGNPVSIENRTKYDLDVHLSVTAEGIIHIVISPAETVQVGHIIIPRDERKDVLQ